MRSRILLGLLLGTVGGLIAWISQETLINYAGTVQKDVLTGACNLVSPSESQSRIFAFCLGGFIGMLLGMVDGLVEGNARKVGQGMLLGGGFGILLGTIGYNLGQVIYAAIGGQDSGGAGIFSFTRQVISRSLGWAVMGMALGAGVGLPTRSPRRILNGVIGGFIGGLIGGFVFDMVAITARPLQGASGVQGCAEVGGPSRAIGIPAIGAAIGLFIGIVDELFKQAWVKVLAGQNEGKDFILSKPMNLIGRDERCEVPLYSDPQVGAQHAAIRADGKRHVLIDAGSPLGTIVNGQRVDPGGEVLLRDGDMIQVGSQRILFREKATQSRVAPPPLDVAKSKPGGASVAVPSNVCQYCGSAKKADGSCLCTLDAGPSGMAPPPYEAQQQQPFGSAPYGTAPIAQMPGYAPTPGFAAAGAPPSRLVGLDGAYAGQIFTLSQSEISVGREPGRDILLSGETTVSRNHAQLQATPSGLVVNDLGSANGTFVNGMRVQSQLVVVGDMLQFGAAKFRVE